MSINFLSKGPQKREEALADFVSSKDRFKERLATLSYINGVITAAIVGPEHVPFGEWLPLVVDLSDASCSEEDSRLAAVAIRFQHDKVIKRLRSRTGEYEPFFWENDEGRLITRDWALGFLAGIRLHRDAWKQLEEVETRWLLPVLTVLLQDEKIDAKIVEMGLEPEAGLDAAAAWLPDLIAALYSIRKEEPAGLAPFRRLEKKTGRNDPCPSRNTWLGNAPADSALDACRRVIHI
jgi:yecA family protein